MKLFVGESCKNLFFKVLLLSVLLNICFHLPYFFPIDTMVFLVLSVLQLCASLALGIFIRRKNKLMLEEQMQERKYYLLVTWIIVVFALATVCFPEMILRVVVVVGRFLYETIGLERWFSQFDLLSTAICLVSVFFYRKKADRKIVQLG